jgi:molybdenum cofactor synthesis domain-containing protein
MKKIKVEEAIGSVLPHDVTRIKRGEFKGPAFKKGHIIKEEDIPELKKLGKNYLYVMELGTDELHENDAAKRIAPAISGQGLVFSEPVEGKINISADYAGLFKVNVEALLAVNRMENIIVATLKNNFPCKKGQIVAGTRIIPLTIKKDRIEGLEALAKKTETPILSVKPYHLLKVGAVITGSEVYNGLITDDFGPSIGKKLTDSGCAIIKKIVVPDDEKKISKAVLELKSLGCELIITTGGLSVDPDDVTRSGVLATGAKSVFYGSPVLPGAMLMVSYLDEIPIISLPACVFYYKRTVFDLIFPKFLAGETITGDEIAAMGHGGLCMNCEVCHYPVCSFGR